MTAPLLYCGDTSLRSAAAYLAGLFATWKWEFDYCPSDQAVAPSFVRGRRLVILSDYPSARMNAETQRELVDAVSAGTSLLMIGGWESFHGLGGDWDQSLIATALPVIIESHDDRFNCDHPVLVRQISDHPSAAGLPWEKRPPTIGGFNRFRAQLETQVVLEVDRLRSRFHNGVWQVDVLETHPLLVFGTHHRGKTAALATDAAPHWVGGLVDWGDGRVAGQADGADAIEVGDLYAQFWRQLLGYLLA